ncbi:hypothetical protein FB45DRAFT_906476 [Roridomyces roridus]|uniref:Uncharacterized protein n=1 Tax=Roridomyces roridus TaxID=1738132 RepID=A0AAD7FSV6_9AGAR|nr:hypothetical protein FB45DRAFT_906476 [Roridomyces roridus]
MKTLLISFALAASALASAVPSSGFSSSCPASERVLVETHNVTAGGHEFQVSTKACSAEILAAHSAQESKELQKRQTFDSCVGETMTFGCFGAGAGPTLADCTALSSAMVAAFEQPGQPILFTVLAGFVQEFSHGTCLYAWINENPAGTVTLQYCYSSVSQDLGLTAANNCLPRGDLGGFATASNPQLIPASLDWVFEVVHS